MTRDELVRACQKALDVGGLTAESLAAGLIEAGLAVTDERRSWRQRLLALFRRD